MIEIGDKKYRNLQEQVLKNMQDIEALQEQETGNVSTDAPALTSGALILGAGNNKITLGPTPTAGYILTGTAQAGVEWKENKVAETAEGEVTVNEGLTVNENGDVEVGKDLEVDGDITVNGEINGYVKAPNALTPGRAVLSLAAGQIYDSVGSDGQVLTSRGGVVGWETPSGGGGHLYLHTMYFYGPFTGWVSVQHINSSSSNLGWGGLSDWLKNNGFTGTNKAIPAYGIINNKQVIACYNSRPEYINYIAFRFADGSTDYDTSAAAVTEVVTQIM